MTKELKVKAPKKKKIASLERKKSRAGWIFVLPFVLGFLLIYLFKCRKVPGYFFLA